MIEPRQIRDVATTMLKHLRERSKPTYGKNGRMRGKLVKCEVPVPFDLDLLYAWLIAKYGPNAFLCPYCNAPLDVLSATLDHDIPLRPGGNELTNLLLCCADCNGLKHKLTAAEYLEFRRKMRELPAHVEANILQRLRNGAMGMRMAQQLRAGKIGPTQPALPAPQEEPF